MGYYTDYDLSGNDWDVMEAIREECPYTIHSQGYITGVKWYDHMTHMKNVSLKFPDKLLILEGKGEEPEDIWKAYFKNGKACRVEAQIVFPDFDEGMLK